MGIKQALKVCVIGAGVLGVAPLFADEVGSEAQAMNQQERIAQHEEMQNRVRNLSQEERPLMRETPYSGRAAMEGGESGRNATARDRWRDGSGLGNQYGRGFEARQGGGRRR